MSQILNRLVLLHEVPFSSSILQIFISYTIHLSCQESTVLYVEKSHLGEHSEFCIF